jgi:hypothetical protein
MHRAGCQNVAPAFCIRLQGIELELKASVPFQPNTALIFVTPQGVHGAELPKDSDPAFERVSYQFLACLDSKARRLVERRWKPLAAAIQ